MEYRVASRFEGIDKDKERWTIEYRDNDKESWSSMPFRHLKKSDAEIHLKQLNEEK